MNRFQQRLAAASVLALALLAAPAFAAYDALYVFGDSLSDVGNVRSATLTAVPGGSYFEGRFSNGPNYVDNLSAALGLGEPQHSRAGGNVHAHGGARVSGTGFPTSLFVRDVDDQVDVFLDDTPAADAGALYVVFAGANDLIERLDDDPSLSLADAADTLARQVERLYDAGAREVLTANLPLLGLVPRYNDTAASAARASDATRQFNALYAAELDDLESRLADLTLFRADVAGTFADLAADPSAFGLTNVTDPAAPGLSPGDLFYDESRVVPNPDDYLFWDDIHPTRAGHALLAQTFLTAIPEPGSIALLVVAAPLVLRRSRAA